MTILGENMSGLLVCKEAWVNLHFDDPKHDYPTSVNPASTDSDLCIYFVGTSFDLGGYPEENLQVCKSIDVCRKYVAETE